MNAEFVEVDPKLMADAAATIDRHADEMAASVIASDGDHGGTLTVSNTKAALLMHLLYNFEDGRKQLGYLYEQLKAEEAKEALARFTLPVSKKPQVH